MGVHVHRLSEVDAESRRAVCANCGPTDLHRDGKYWRCGVGSRQKDALYRADPEAQALKRVYSRKYHQAKYDPKTYRRVWLKKRFGITPEEFDAQLESQGGCCATCKKKLPERDRYPHQDHCHETGFNRGILCSRCNRALGMVGDDVEVLRSLAVYVEFWRDKHAGVADSVEDSLGMTPLASD